MNTDYPQILDTVQTELQQINPQRVVTRTYRDFNDRKIEDLEKGIFTIISGGVGEYPSLDPPGAFGRLGIVIIFQGVLPEGCTGPELEAMEFAAMNELEQLAAEYNPEILAALTIKRAPTSQQLESPFCWVRSEWENWTDPERQP